MIAKGNESRRETRKESQAPWDCGQVAGFATSNLLYTEISAAASPPFECRDQLPTYLSLDQSSFVVTLCLYCSTSSIQAQHFALAHRKRAEAFPTVAKSVVLCRLTKATLSARSERTAWSSGQFRKR